ncbi:MAG: cation-translocating P-type ATPase [Caulobacter sp.]|nr:cation-translocating P-type ATPase [Caulobacter sp.]
MTPSLQGLSEIEARRRLQEAGPNEIPGPPKRNLGRIGLETLREPMFLLLMVAAGLYLTFGDLAEGLFLLGGATMSIALVVIQEARSERALMALRELAQPRVRVIRDGIEHQVLARELAPGDMVLVAEGERLTADGVLVEGGVLSIDESVLTGEAAPVIRTPNGDFTGEDDDAPSGVSARVYGGTLVVSGQGVVRMTQTGARSAIGKLGGSLAAIAPSSTPLQRSAKRLAALIGALAIAFSIAVAIAYGLLRGDWGQGALAAVTIAIALIPEEFPMVLAVFLALGAWRLAAHQVLVRRSAVIETLGAASVLCVDKTGTLTENQMRVARLWTPSGETAIEDGAELGEPSVRLLRICALACAVRPVDPMDKAVLALCSARSIAFRADKPGPSRVWPLQAERLAVVQLWAVSGKRMAAAKGAPEAIFQLCRLSDDDKANLQRVVESYAAQGLRVLGVAACAERGLFPADPSDARFEFFGLLGFVDPLRADAAAALDEASKAGLKVIMITGDHPATALAIARTAGLSVDAGALTGEELAALSEAAFRERLKHVRVFARIRPEQKLRLVEILKASGEVVAMTGDGVNDAPALEAAHIGVAMGRRGADVAREAADLVLLDDSFASIVEGVRLGRRIFANLRRAMTYITAVHVPIAGLALAPILFGLPPVLLPMHVVLLELIVDPTSSLVFEAAPADSSAMRRPPRDIDEPLFGPGQIGLAMLQGLGVLVASGGLYVSLLHGGSAAPVARGAAFLTLVTGNLILALIDAFTTGNLFGAERRVLWLITFLVSAILGAIFTFPAVGAIFQLASLPPHLAIFAMLLAASGGGWALLVAAASSRH